MAVRARLAPPPLERKDWPYHTPKAASLPIGALLAGDRRMEADNYLLSGYGFRAALEARSEWKPLYQLARVWQPLRLEGVQVSPKYGTPYLAATQVFDLRPVPRKWLSLERISVASALYVKRGMILVTRSGAVGRATLGYAPHLETLISDDLLRIEARDEKQWGWLYAYLRSPTIRAIMTSAQYGHVIKHLEVAHLDALPVPELPDSLLDKFNERARAVLELREQAHVLSLQAEQHFSQQFGDFTPPTKNTFEVNSAQLYGARRRLESTNHTPLSNAILKRFSDSNFVTEPLRDLNKRTWTPGRASRVFSEEGEPYMSANDLFAINPIITKRIAPDQQSDGSDYVEPGWLMMACSGQVYGLLGSVVLMTEHHTKNRFSQDMIRIVADTDKVRPGYLAVALGHPLLGRPLVTRFAYGTSIPHLDPTDINTIPIVRLPDADESLIADHAEKAAQNRAEADFQENALADEAERILMLFAAGRPLL